MIYIVNMVIRYTENNVFLGLSRTFDGCLDILRDHFPAQTNLEKLSHSPTGIMYRVKGKPELYIHIYAKNRCDFDGDKGWVVCKRREGTMTENVYAIFNNKEDMQKFVEANIDEPTYTFREKCGITEVDGYIPFSRIIGDQNPELNKIHYTIYETEVKS